MGASLGVQGIILPDEKWEKMKAVWDACKKAGVDAPDSVYEYFNDLEPDPSGIVVEFETYSLDKNGAENENGLSRYTDDGLNGIEVNLSKINPDIQKLRFYVSY